MRAGLASLRTDNDYQRAAQRVGSTYLTGYFPLDATMKGRLNGAITPVVTGAKPGQVGDGDGPHGRGSGTRFAATGDRVTFGTGFNYTGNHTYVLWIRPTVATQMCVLSQYDGSNGGIVNLYSDGHLLYETNNASNFADFASTSTTPPVLFNRWNCISVTYSNGGFGACYARFSVNGSTFQTLGPNAYPAGAGANPLTLGVYANNNTSFPFTGDMAHLSIYNEDMDITYVRELIGAMQR